MAVTFAYPSESVKITVHMHQNAAVVYAKPWKAMMSVALSRAGYIR